MLRFTLAGAAASALLFTPAASASSPPGHSPGTPFRPPSLAASYTAATGAVSSSYTAGENYPPGVLAIDVYRVAVPFDTMLPGYPVRVAFPSGMTPGAPYIYGTTVAADAPPGSYEVVEDYGYTGEGHCARDGVMTFTLCEVPAVELAFP